MNYPATFNPNIAHICEGQEVFQVLNAGKTAWDEVETAKSYGAYRSNASWVAANTLASIVSNVVTTVGTILKP